MEKNMKTIKRFALLSLCVLILAAACQPTPAIETLPPTETATQALPTEVPPTQTPSPTSVPTLVVDLDALKGQIVTVAYPGTMDVSRVNQLLADFNLTNAWDIRVVGAAYSSDDLLADALQQGEIDANVVIGTTYDLLDPQNKIALLSLNDYINDPTWGALDDYQADSPFAAVSPKPDESEPRYSIPLVYNAGLLFYQATWAEELGFSAEPLAWSDFVSQMQAGLQANISDDNYVNNGTGSLLLSKSVMSAQSWYAAYGGTYTLENQVLNLQDDALEASFIALKQAFADDTSWAGLEPTPYQYFVDRFALAYEGTLSDLSEQENYSAEQASEETWETIPYPTEDGKGSIALESISAAIVTESADTDLAAWFFVKWMLQPSQQIQLVEITSFWPATGHPALVAADYAALHPAWATALPEGVHVTLAPEAGSWGVNRFVLQDAYMRVYGLAPEYFSSIIDVLKQTLAENPVGQP